MDLIVIGHNLFFVFNCHVFYAYIGVVLFGFFPGGFKKKKKATRFFLE